MVSPPRGSPHGTLLFCGPRADFAGRLNWDAWLTARGCPRTSFPPAGSDRAGCWILRVGVGRGARSSTCGLKVVHRCPALAAVTLRRCRPRYAEWCHRPRVLAVPMAVRMDVVLVALPALGCRFWLEGCWG
jgi:hypothetical protein